MVHILQAGESTNSLSHFAAERVKFTKSRLSKAFVSVLVGGSILLSGLSSVRADVANDGIKRLTKADFETQVIGHFDNSWLNRYDTRPYITNGYREEEAARHVYVVPLTDEDENFEQKWKIVYNEKNFWMDGTRTPYKGSDYSNKGYKANPYFGFFLSDDLELVGNATYTIMGRKPNSEELDGRMQIYEGQLTTQRSQDYWTDPLDDTGFDNGRLQGAIRMDRKRNTTLGQDDLPDLQNVLNDPRDNNAFFRFSRIEYDKPDRGTGGSETILNDVGTMFSTYLYTGKDYREKSTFVTLEFTTKRDPGRYYEGEHTTFVAGLYNSYDWNGKDVRVYSKQYLHSSKRDVDTDGDGLVDRLEYFLGSNPNNRDSDGDGKEDGVEVIRKEEPLLQRFDGLYKVHGTDPMIAPPTLPERKFFGIAGEIIEGTATPNSVIAIYPYANGERSDVALAEAIADDQGHYKLVVGKVFQRQTNYNEWNNTIVLESSDGGKFVPAMTDRKPNIPPGSKLELTSWSDGFDGRPLFSHPELAVKQGELVDLNKPFEDLVIDPKTEVKDPTNLTEDEKKEIKDKIKDNEDLSNVIKGDDKDERGENIKVNPDGSVEVKLKDDTVVVIPPDKVVENPAAPKAELTLIPVKPAQGQTDRPAEGTDITIGGKVIKDKTEGEPMTDHNITLVVKTGTGEPETIQAKTNEKGEIVDRTSGQPIKVKAGKVGEITEVKLYDGDSTEGEPLTRKSVIAGRDPDLVNVPSFEGDYKSTVTVTNGPIPADGKTPHTVTVKLVNKYGDPIRGASDKIELTKISGEVTIGDKKEGQNGTYTVDLTSTTPGKPSVKVVYKGDEDKEISGSPLTPEFRLEKPQAPGLEPPTEGTKTVVVTPNGEDVNKITLEVPGNGTIVLTKNGEGVWTASGEATIEMTPQGKITVTVPNPISTGDVTAVATNGVGDSDKTTVKVTPLTPEATLELKPESPSKDDPSKPIEGTDIVVDGKVTKQGEAGTPLVERPLTIVVTQGDQTYEIEAKTDKDGNIVDRGTGEKISIPAGNAGDKTTVKLYDGDETTGTPLATKEVEAAVDPEKGVPNFNENDANHSKIEASAGPVVADGEATYTVTVTLVDKKGGAVTGQKDNIHLTGSDQALNISEITEGEGGKYTATVSSTKDGSLTVTATYGDENTNIPNSPLTLTFDKVATPVQPTKPVAPNVTAPTKGDLEVKLDQPEENVTEIWITIPGTGRVVLKKGDDGTWTTDNPEVTVALVDGKLVITVPTPIEEGNVTGLVRDKNGTSSDPFSVPVIVNETPEDNKPAAPSVTPPTEGDTTLVVGLPEGNITTITAVIPGNGTITLQKGEAGWTDPTNPGATAVDNGGTVTITVPNQIDKGTVTVTVTNDANLTSDPTSVEVVETTEPDPKPVDPQPGKFIIPPTEGDTELKLNPPTEEITKITAEIPGNGTIVLEKDENGNWTAPNNPGVTAELVDGKLVIGPLNPIDKGQVTVTEEDNNGGSESETVDVIEKSNPEPEPVNPNPVPDPDPNPNPNPDPTPVQPVKPVVPEIKQPTEGDTELVITPPADDITKIVAVIPGNGTVTLEKGESGWTAPSNPGVTVEENNGNIVVKLPDPIIGGEVVVTVEKNDGTPSDPVTIPVKPVAPEIKQPTEGDTELVITPPADDVTKIVAVIPGNGTVTLEKGEDGKWTAPSNPGVTVEENNGNIIVKLPDPISGGEVVITVENNDGTPSDPVTIPVKEKTPIAPEIKHPSVGDKELVINPPADDVTKIVAVIPGNGTVTLEKGEDGKWTAPSNPGVTVEEKDGKLVVKLPNPIKAGTIELRVENKNGTSSITEKIKVKDKAGVQKGGKAGGGAGNVARTGETAELPVVLAILALTLSALVIRKRFSKDA